MESISSELPKKDSIKKIVAIMSGKGGVGKSTIAVMLADSLINHGYKVGILDADIAGPSIPSLLNIHKVHLGAEQGTDSVIPFLTEKGLKVVSMNLLLDDENQPVIWKGAILSTIIQQLWTRVKWGELDYLIIDMPPGTSDIALTVLQQIRPNAVIMVSIPQDLAQLIVHRAIEMVNQMNIKMLGVVLNMSYYTCPCCGEDFVMYKKSLEEFSKYRILAELPAMIPLAELSCSEGTLSAEGEELIKPVVRVIIDETKVMSIPY